MVEPSRPGDLPRCRPGPVDVVHPIVIEPFQQRAEPLVAVAGLRNAPHLVFVARREGRPEIPELLLEAAVAHDRGPQLVRHAGQRRQEVVHPFGDDELADVADDGGRAARLLGGPEDVHVAARVDDLGVLLPTGDDRCCLSDHVVAAAGDDSRPRQALAGKAQIALLFLDRVLQGAPVELGHVGVAGEASGLERDVGAHHLVPGHDRIGLVLADGGDERVDVRLRVAVELLVGEVREALHDEPLIVVVDVDRQQAFDRRPHDPTATRRGRPTAARRGEGRVVEREVAVLVDELQQVGLSLLAQQQDVVAGLSPHARQVGGVEVGSRPRQQVAVPQQDPHEPGPLPIAAVRVIAPL